MFDARAAGLLNVRYNRARTNIVQRLLKVFITDHPKT